MDRAPSGQVIRRLFDLQEMKREDSKGTLFKTFTLEIPMAEIAEIAMCDKKDRRL